jgi:hypothetical protein
MSSEISSVVSELPDVGEAEGSGVDLPFSLTFSNVFAVSAGKP